MLLEYFPELIGGGGAELLTELLHLTKKFFSKFFGYVRSSAVSSILSLSKNVTRVFPTIHSGGTRILNRTLAFNEKIPFVIFCVCLKLCSFFDFEFIEKFYETFL